jgi:ubiquinone/menaquinone biosynthesis C-methylase UbiE
VNRLHHWYCNREAWKQHVREDLVPVALEGVDLGDAVLEVGPGFGPATEVLVGRGGRVTALEIDPGLARALEERLGRSVEVVEGSGSAMPFADATFSGAACFTMLHHVPSPDEQDRVFAEVRRVLRPGGVFAGTDSRDRGVLFRMIHIGDTLVPVDPATFPARMAAAGFEEPRVDSSERSFRFSARKPA